MSSFRYKRHRVSKCKYRSRKNGNVCRFEKDVRTERGRCGWKAEQQEAPLAPKEPQKRQQRKGLANQDLLLHRISWQTRAARAMQPHVTCGP